MDNCEEMTPCCHDTDRLGLSQADDPHLGVFIFWYADSQLIDMLSRVCPAQYWTSGLVHSELRTGFQDNYDTIRTCVTAPASMSLFVIDYNEQVPA